MPKDETFLDDQAQEQTPEPGKKETPARNARAKRREAAALNRRSFLKGLGVTAAGLAVASRTNIAQAANGWNMGVVDNMTDDLLVDMYTKMLRSRWWEEMIKDAFLAGDDGLYGSYHIYIGQEAVAVGAISALREDDYIASTHRGHGHLIAKGGDLNKMSAEIFFKETGYNKAFGGSMHITDVSKGILGMNGIVGPAHLLSAGAAYGAKVRGTDQVAMAFGGDGSVQNGWFYSGLRNAALYDLPLVIVIENNGMQISMPTENTIRLRDLSKLAAGLEVPGVTVDGTDVLAVYGAAQEAVERARAGGGPTLIEAKTYRWYDHAGLAGAQEGSMGAFGLPYRSDREVRAWMQRDPIDKLRRMLVANEILDDTAADSIVDSVKAEVRESIEFARRSPVAKAEEGLKNVFAEGSVAASQYLA